jgi:hypothetical protein
VFNGLARIGIEDSLSPFVRRRRVRVDLVILNRFGDPRLAGLTSPNLHCITKHFGRDPEGAEGRDA